jgi:hypothetical protein
MLPCHACHTRRPPGTSGGSQARGPSDGGIPETTREIQGCKNQEEGCPSVGAVGEADEARSSRDSSTASMPGPKGRRHPRPSRCSTSQRPGRRTRGPSGTGCASPSRAGSLPPSTGTPSGAAERQLSSCLVMSFVSVRGEVSASGRNTSLNHSHRSTSDAYATCCRGCGGGSVGGKYRRSTLHPQRASAKTKRC